MKDRYKEMFKKYNTINNQYEESKNVDLYIVDYLENLNSELLIIDDISGVGKTHTVRKIIVENVHSLQNIKYYSLLDAEKINDDFEIKSYIVDNLMLIGTTSFVSLFFNKKINIKINKTIKNFYFFICNAINGLLDAFLNYKEKEYRILKGFRNIFKDMVKLNSSFLLVIDDVERKKNNLSLKNLFSKLEQIQKDENIKIVLIMNSKNLNKEDKDYLSNERYDLLLKKISLNSNYKDLMTKLSEIDDIKNVIEIMKFKGTGNNFRLERFYPILRNINILRNAESFLQVIFYLLKDININFDDYEKNNIKKINNIHPIYIKNGLIEELLVHYLTYSNGLNNCNLSNCQFNNECSNIYEAIKDSLNYNNKKLEKYINNKLVIENEYDFIKDFNKNFINHLKISDIQINKNLIIYDDNIYFKYDESILNLIDVLDRSIVYAKNYKENKFNYEIFAFKKEAKISHFKIINLCENIFTIFSEFLNYSLVYLEEKRRTNYEIDILLLETIKNCREKFKEFEIKLEYLRNDIFVKSLKKELGLEFGNFLCKINKLYISNQDFTSNILIIKYDMIINNKSDYIIEKICNSSDIEKLIIRLQQIDKNIIDNLYKMLKELEESKNRNIKHFYKRINSAVNNINKNNENNIIEFVDNKELKDSNLKPYFNYYTEKEILSDLNILNAFKNKNN